MLNRCAGCKIVFYCNKQCQASHWKEHKTICHSLKRINALLDIVQDLENKKDDKGDDDCICGVVCNFYQSKNVKQFFIDYANFVENIDSHKMYMVNNGVCNMEICKHFRREYRNRNIYDKNEKKRYELYNHCKTEKDIIIQQTLDQIHIIKNHLNELGLRHIHIDNHQHKGNNDQFIQMRDSLTAKRNTFNKIRPDLLKYNNNNKFVTKILQNDDDDQKKSK